MPSPSISGRPLAAATTNGVVELTPPASPHSTPSILRPSNRSSLRNAIIISSPCGSFSVITVGAPIMHTGTISASSAISLDVDQPRPGRASDRLLRHQLADIGIAAAAGAEDRAADGDVVEIGDADRAKDLEAGHRARAPASGCYGRQAE